MACVLLIEDDKDLRESLASILMDHGHDVFQASDGEAAFVMANEHVPDVVVCDLIMEGTEGIATIRGLRKLRADLPILSISGNALYLDNSKKLGADDALLKPFTATAFIEAIDQLLPVN